MVFTWRREKELSRKEIPPAAFGSAGKPPNSGFKSFPTERVMFLGSRHGASDLRECSRIRGLLVDDAQLGVLGTAAAARKRW